MNETTLSSIGVDEGITPVEPRPYYPAASQQRRMFALQRLGGTATAYNMPIVLPVHESISIKTVREFINWLIARHEALRTSFFVKDGEIVQRVHASKTLEVEVETIEKSRLHETMRAFVSPFDLSQAPLLRAKFVASFPFSTTRIGS